VGLQDFDNDGWKDIFAAQGHVLDNVEKINSSLQYLERPSLYRNVSGKFEISVLEEMPKIAGRGAAFGDLDNDGSTDAVVSALGGRPIVLCGKANGNHWITLQLQGTHSSRDGQGAKVRIGRQWVYATTSGSYLSASDGRVHFGLGSQTRAQIEIQWPSGKRQSLEDVAADRIIAVKEPE
jgi:hypothetical protein